MKLSSSMELPTVYPINMTSVLQKKTSGAPSLGSELLSLFDHNDTLPDLLSSSIDLGSLESFQDAGLPFEGVDAIAEVEGCEELPSLSDSYSYEGTQQLIEEMDVFIRDQEENFPVVNPSAAVSPDLQNNSTAASIASSPVLIATSTMAHEDQETNEAVQMLDALIQGQIPMNWNDRTSTTDSTYLDAPPTATISPELLLSTISLDSLADSPWATPCSTLSPASSIVTEFSPPSSVITSPCRTELKRSGRQKLIIKDKKERKKWQNVEAARRYREKKRAMANEHLSEAKDLEEQNKHLKRELNEAENKLSTMKKLMIELGMIKIASSP